MTSDDAGPADPSRRRLLRLVAVVAAGSGIALLGSGLLFNSRTAPGGPDRTAPPTLAANAGLTAEGAASYSRIKVKYFQMASTLPGIREEFFTLRSPARFSELLAEVVDRHPVLLGMVPNMLVLIDGLVAKADSPLNDGDEVDFIPATAGG